LWSVVAAETNKRVGWNGLKRGSSNCLVMAFLPVALFSRLLYSSIQLLVLLRKEIGSGCWGESIWGYRWLLGGKDWGAGLCGRVVCSRNKCWSKENFCRSVIYWKYKITRLNTGRRLEENYTDLQ